MSSELAIHGVTGLQIKVTRYPDPGGFETVHFDVTDRDGAATRLNLYVNTGESDRMLAEAFEGMRVPA